MARTKSDGFLATLALPATSSATVSSSDTFNEARGWSNKQDAGRIHSIFGKKYYYYYM